jgi:trimeric autotransporter adhesin
MRKGAIRSTRYLSLWLVAAAVCLCPPVAQALDPTSTATGTGALAHESTGSKNTANGYVALESNTTGRSNTAVGAGALNFNTTGNYNTASGHAALTNNTAGNYNTANGYNALNANTTGSYNTASGGWVLIDNTTGDNNTASGYSALYRNTTGNDNTASGYRALFANTTGRNNVAIGTFALAAINGINNIGLGSNAGRLSKSGDFNIYIDNRGVDGSESRVIRIGEQQTRTFIAGIAGAPLSGSMVVINSNGQLGVIKSSARYKQDIKPLGGAADKLGRLRPVSFRYKTEPGATHYGLIAEEVDRVMPELVVRDEQNRPESIQYLGIIPLLLQERWEQRARIDKQEVELTRQRALIEQLATEVAELRRTRFGTNTAPKH